MRLLDKIRIDKKLKKTKQAQRKLIHIENDINRNKAPSKSISLMYCTKDESDYVVMMEKDKKSVSMIPKTKMNEIRLGEKGDTITLNDIAYKYSAKQASNVHPGYHRYWMINGVAYGVKPGYLARLDLGSTPSSFAIYNGSYYEPWHPTPWSGYNNRSDCNPVRFAYWSGDGSVIFRYQCTIGSKNNSIRANINRTKGFVADRNPANFGIQVLYNGTLQRDIYYYRRTYKELPEVFICPWPIYDYLGGWWTLGINPRKLYFRVYNYIRWYSEYNLHTGDMHTANTWADIFDWDHVRGKWNKGENCIRTGNWETFFVAGPNGDKSDFGHQGYYPRDLNMLVFPRDRT